MTVNRHSSCWKRARAIWMFKTPRLLWASRVIKPTSPLSACLASHDGFITCDTWTNIGAHPEADGFKAGIWRWSRRPPNLQKKEKRDNQLTTHSKKKPAEGWQVDPPRLLTTDQKYVISLHMWAMCSSGRTGTATLRTPLCQMLLNVYQNQNPSLLRVWTQAWQLNEFKSISEGHHGPTARSPSEAVCLWWHQRVYKPGEVGEDWSEWGFF